MFHQYLRIISFVLLLSLSIVFQTITSFAQDDEFFIISNDDYYNPRNYEPEPANSDNVVENITNYEANLSLGNISGIPTGSSPADDSRDINFIAAGDWNCNQQTSNTVNEMIKFKPELIVGLGDYTVKKKTPQCFFDMTKPIDGLMKIATGNHDVIYKSYYHELLDHYHILSPYYSFNFQNIHFVTISTEHPFEKDSLQYEFIKNDLEKSLQDPSILWRIVFMHQPLYTSADFGEEEAEDLKETYHELFESYNVDLVLSGHTQYYQRSIPLSYNYDDPFHPIAINQDNNGYTNEEGIIFLTVGTAGDELHKIEHFLPYYIIQEERYGFLNFDIKDEGHSLIGTFYDTENLEIFDQFVVSKDNNGNKIYSKNPGQDPNNYYHFVAHPKSDTTSLKTKPILNSNEYYKMKLDGKVKS